MDRLTALERTALDAILAEGGASIAIKHQLSHAEILSRENTGGGFLATLQVDPNAELLNPVTPSLGKHVWIAIDGLVYGLGAILHFKNGRANLLEGYAVGPEDTLPIDFAHVRFAIIQEPGPLPPYGS